MRASNYYKYLFFLLVQTLLISTVYSQHNAYFIGEGVSKLPKLVADAQAAYDSSDYYSAYKLYGEAVKLDKNNTSYQFQFAEAAREYGAFCIARNAYGALLKIDSLNQSAIYRFAEMTKMCGLYRSADTILSKLNYVSDIEDPVDLTASIQRDQLDLEFEAEMNNPLWDTKNIVNKLDAINTSAAEYNPVWRNGQLYYGSMNFQKKEDVLAHHRNFTKTLRYDMENTTAEFPDFNVPDKSTTHLSFSPDDKLVFFTICDYKGKRSDMRCDIYYKIKTDDITDEWGEAIPIHTINDASYTSTHPSYGLNELMEPVLYFVSDRGGDKNDKDLDIWSTKIDRTNLSALQFSAPSQLSGPINTAFNEITPFYHFDSHTLYFSSNGHTGFGGYDINKWPLDNRLDRRIQNLGKDFNSSEHDFNYFLKPDSEIGYFVSNRDGCESTIEEVGCHDIYEIDICQTDLLICLFDEETKLPLSDGLINLLNIDLKLSNSETAHCFSRTELPALAMLTAAASQEGYISKEVDLNIIACEDNKFDIYLKKKPCASLLTVNVFGEKLDGKIPLAMDTIRIQALGSTEIGESKFTGLSTTASFSVDAVTGYDIVVSHPDYLAGKSRMLRTEREAKLGCLDTVEVVLIPKKIVIEKPIACYFDHAIPARIRRNGAVDPTRIKNSQFSYGRYFGQYTARTKQREYENTFPDKSAVQSFFRDSVIANNQRLITFRDEVYANLIEDKSVTYEITIKGYCSFVGTSDFNINLAHRRVESVYKFLREKLNDRNIAANRITFKQTPIGEEAELYYPTQKEMNGKYNPKSCRQRRVEVIGIRNVGASNNGL